MEIDQRVLQRLGAVQDILDVVSVTGSSPQRFGG